MSNQPLDMPDNYPWLPGSGKSQLGDLGELAVRLGSPMSYDRRGSVLWYTLFSNGLGDITTSFSGTAGEITLSADQSLRGGFSCKIRPAQDNISNSFVTASFSASIISAYGCEFSVSPSAFITEINVLFQSIFNSVTMRGHIIYNLITHKITYEYPLDTFTVLDTVTIAAASSAFFSTFKLVINPETGFYQRFLLNRNEYDLSDIPLVSSVGSDYDYVSAQIYFKSSAASRGTAYLDDIIITVGDI